MADQKSSDRRPRFSDRLTRILSVTRWICLVIFAGVVGFHYSQPGSWGSGQRDHVSELKVDDNTEELVQQIAKAAPDPDQYVHETSVKLVEMGHQLIDEPRYRAYVAKKLHELSTDPATFDDDPASYLVLRAAYWQLRHDPQLSGSAEAALLMWQAADQIDRNRYIRSVHSQYNELTP